MKFVEEFKKFTLRGNLIDLAIGFTVGAAFSTVAKSLVNDVIMPPVGMLLGGMDFADLFILLRQGSEELPPYSTLKAAQSSGAVTVNYGLFINNVIALVLVALVMFLIIRLINKLEAKLEEQFGDTQDTAPSSKKCSFCRETIAYKATRCPHCTSRLDEVAADSRPVP
jgi:large conductance mechanosensitive channel